jgi:hypothetical protein
LLWPPLICFENKLPLARVVAGCHWPSPFRRLPSPVVTGGRRRGNADLPRLFPPSPTSVISSLPPFGTARWADQNGITVPASRQAIVGLLPHVANAVLQQPGLSRCVRWPAIEPAARVVRRDTSNCPGVLPWPRVYFHTSRCVVGDGACADAEPRKCVGKEGFAHGCVTSHWLCPSRIHEASRRQRSADRDERDIRASRAAASSCVDSERSAVTLALLPSATGSPTLLDSLSRQPPIHGDCLTFLNGGWCLKI